MQTLAAKFGVNLSEFGTFEGDKWEAKPISKPEFAALDKLGQFASAAYEYTNTGLVHKHERN